jgi:signal transduction histidine kinase
MRSVQRRGFAPSLHLQGTLDAPIPEEIIDQMLTALRESLSNEARHASATSVAATVAVADELVLTVRDDGVGIAPGGQPLPDTEVS